MKNSDNNEKPENTLKQKRLSEVEASKSKDQDAQPAQTKIPSPKKQLNASFNVSKPLEEINASPKKQPTSSFTSVQKSSQTNSMSPRKQLDSSFTNSSKSSQTNDQSPKRKRDPSLTYTSKAFQHSPQKSSPRYRPVAEDKIQTDIVNAIVARDAEASMKKEGIAQQSNVAPMERSPKHSNIEKVQPLLSPKKQMSKGMTRKQVSKKDGNENTKSPKRKPRKVHQKSRDFMTSKDNSQQDSTINKQASMNQLQQEVPVVDADPPSSMPSNDNDKTSDEMKNLKEFISEESKPDLTKEKILPNSKVSHVINGSPRKTVKPAGPLIKRSPFKNNPKFNKKQHGDRWDAKNVDKGLKPEGKKNL